MGNISGRKKGAEIRATAVDIYYLFGNVKRNLSGTEKLSKNEMMPTAFAKFLVRAIDDRFESRRAFLRAAEPKSNENGSNAYLSQVISGKKPPPIDRITAWAAALELKGIELERFLDLACIAHLPGEVQPRFEKILGRLEAAEEALTHLTRNKR